ncbi:MAG: glycoside hydrolase family 15 protein [Patulibacter minatonensis]
MTQTGGSRRTLTRDDGYLPIEDYGVISDGRTIALVGADAGIDWWCVPAPDAPPLLDRLLGDGPHAGRFSIEPTDDWTVERAYRDGSNVLETTFTTAHGRVRITDSLNSGHAGRLPRSELARRVEGLEGHVELRIELCLGARFGETPPRGPVVPNDGAFRLGDLVVQLRTSDDCAAGIGGHPGPADDGRSSLRLRTSPGSRSTLALLVTDGQPLMDTPIATIDARIDRSDRQWKDWSADLSYDGPHADRVVRSALALKLLLFSPTGAIAAAATTSLPETPGGGKHWDYRYAWVRDVAYSVKALLRIGGTEEAQAGFAWLVDAIDGDDDALLRPFFTLRGDEPPAATADSLPGYRGHGPVVIGNDARDQLQLGCFGDVLETAELFCRRGNHLDARTARVLERLAETCAGAWRQPDSGMWELEDERQYTMSKIGCWLALRRAADLAEAGQIADTAAGERWAAEAEAVAAWVDEHCWSTEREAYVEFAGADTLDAALLLATRFGFPRPDRLDRTRAAVQAELATGPLVHRLSRTRHEEGAFLACSFWLVEALVFGGHFDAAQRTMDELLAATSHDLGLMSEMVAPATGAFLGNLPQGLSHLAMIHAALALRDGGEEGR